MILSQCVNIKSSVVCFAYQSPNETSNYLNDNLGHFHRYVYLTDGTIYTEVTAPGASVPDVTYQLVANELYDINHSRGKTIKGVTTDIGATMVSFNPVPMDNNISVEIIKDRQTRKIKATERTTVVCLKGSIEANDKPINTMQFATLPLNKSVTLNLPDGAVCAIVTG